MKLVVSIMPSSFEEVEELDISRFDDVDIVEWRADFLHQDEILTVAPAVFEKFAGKELIFTLRTVKEGGNITLTGEEYINLIKSIDTLYHPDYIDFEYFSYQDVFKELNDFPNLVLSYHNFEETPENLMEVFSELTALTPKVVKIAVMPKQEQDVLNLLSFTRGFKNLNQQQSYVTMAMGDLGKFSRIAADLVGSDWSFASLDQASAPGQIALSDMKHFREVLNGN